MSIEVKNLVKSFDNKRIIDDISFKVDDGKILSIVGFSGSGKSTVLKLISGLLEKDSGEIITSGGDIAMVFQYSALFDSLNVFDNISFALQERKDLRGKHTPKELEKIVAEKLELVGLSGIEKKFPSELSGGMQKRVSFARAIVTEPKIILYDEPTAGLDPKERARFRNIISAMSKDRIVILSTHIVSDIESIANQVILIKDRQIYRNDTVSAICAELDGKVYEQSMSNEAYEAFEGEHFILSARQEHDGMTVRFFSEEKEQAGKACVPNLEDFFLVTFR